MTPKQERFVQEYLIDLNATQAAIRAGYSERRAAELGYQLLQKTTVQNALKKAQELRSTRTEVTQDRVIKELSRIAFADPRKVFRWGPDGVTLLDSDGLTDDEAAAIGEVSQTTTESGGSIKAKLLDKVKALELLGRHLGMFVDRTEITGKNSNPIEIIDLSGRSTEELLAIVKAGTGNI